MPLLAVGRHPGFDAKTGKLAWAWDVEHPEWNGYPPAGQTWTKGTPNSWMSSSADEKLGLVYLPMGNFAADYISTGRPAALEPGVELDRRARRHHRQAALGVPDGEEGRVGL